MCLHLKPTRFSGWVVHSYPHRGEEIPGAASVLRDLCKNGHRLILWTCREHVSIDGVDPLREALDWFESYDIPLYAVNEDPCVGSVWIFPSRKVHGDLLIDDKAFGKIGRAHV